MLYESSRLPDTPLKQLRMLSHLCELVALVTEEAEKSGTTLSIAQPWRLIETQLRRQRQYSPSLKELSNMGHCSQTHIVRLCRSATGQSPMQRLREMRLAEGYGLLTWSGMNITQIAEILGYPSIHGFSRDFTKHFGLPPSKIPPKSYLGITQRRKK